MGTTQADHDSKEDNGNDGNRVNEDKNEGEHDNGENREDDNTVGMGTTTMGRRQQAGPMKTRMMRRAAGTGMGTGTMDNGNEDNQDGGTERWGHRAKDDSNRDNEHGNGEDGMANRMARTTRTGTGPRGNKDNEDGDDNDNNGNRDRDGDGNDNDNDNDNNGDQDQDQDRDQDQDWDNNKHNEDNEDNEGGDGDGDDEDNGRTMGTRVRTGRAVDTRKTLVCNFVGLFPSFPLPLLPPPFLLPLTGSYPFSPFLPLLPLPTIHHPSSPPPIHHLPLLPLPSPWHSPGIPPSPPPPCHSPDKVEYHVCR
jgi:hypothetical protein